MTKSFLPGVTRQKQPAPPASTAPAQKNLGRPPRVIVSTILIFIISQLIAVFVVSLVYGIVKPHHPDLDNSIIGQFFYIVLAEGLAAWLAIKLVQNRGLSLAVIGLGRRPKGSDLIKAAIGFAIFYGLIIVASVVINAVSPNLNNQQQDIGFTNISNGGENALAFISLVILPPLGEETLVRGYLFSGLRKYWRFWPALAVTSLIFGAAHLEFGSGGPLVWAAAVDTFLLSIVLCFLRERTGALYAGMLVHMANNLIAFGVHFK